jgi:pimeloyl-ACP methyl ester carboxylesterase
MEFPHGLRLDPIAKGPPQALVVLLPDRGASAATLTPIAGRWATTVPTTAFIVLEKIEQRDPRSCGVPPSPKPTVISCVTRHLELLLEHQLNSCRLDASRLVLVGFGYGGTLALNMLLRQGWSCGVLAFSAKLTRPLPRLLSGGHKVRLIECVGDGHVGETSLRDAVTLLTGRGMDTRGVVLASSSQSEEAIRHGGTYLVELVATAQRGQRYHFNPENLLFRHLS